MTIDFYNQLSEEEKQILIDWFSLTEEAFSVLKANDYGDTEALKILRCIVTCKGIGSEKNAEKLKKQWLSAI